MSQTKHRMGQQNGMITWNSSPDVLKANLSILMFKNIVGDFYLLKY